MFSCHISAVPHTHTHTHTHGQTYTFHSPRNTDLLESVRQAQDARPYERDEDVGKYLDGTAGSIIVHVSGSAGSPPLNQLATFTPPVWQ